MEVQSIIFNKKNHTLKGVKKWLVDHKYKTSFYGKQIENTKNFYRARQKAPSRFEKKSYRMMKKRGGIEFVIGKLKSK
tara:strand:- start:868 stop:1101 length:234 start_codon:yes stop_codon:yes gene_type:complete